jgi:hypothetical protein
MNVLVDCVSSTGVEVHIVICLVLQHQVMLLLLCSLHSDRVTQADKLAPCSGPNCDAVHCTCVSAHHQCMPGQTESLSDGMACLCM